MHDDLDTFHGALELGHVAELSHYVRTRATRRTTIVPAHRVTARFESHRCRVSDGAGRAGDEDAPRPTSLGRPWRGQGHAAAGAVASFAPSSPSSKKCMRLRSKCMGRVSPGTRPRCASICAMTCEWLVVEMYTSILSPKNSITPTFISMMLSFIPSAACGRSLMAW